MAEKTQKTVEVQEQKKKVRPSEEETEVLVRIFGYDVPGSKNILAGLIRIKGISWAIAAAICYKLKIDPITKISSFSKEDIKKMEEYLTTIDLPDFMKNRRFDPDNGKTTHLFGIDLDLKKDLDIKRMKKIHSYKGVRHSAKLPVRGQRTRSHFRGRGKAVGVRKKK